MTDESGSDIQNSDGNSWLSQLSQFDEQLHIHNNLELELERRKGLYYKAYQNCATSIAKVYVERESTRGAEVFRNAARDATLLYKDGVDMSIKLSDMSMNAGYARRNKELLQWAKKRRRFIRREELIALLSQPSQQSSMVQGQGQTRKSPSSLYDYDDDNKHLDTFREAIQSTTPHESQSQLNLIQLPQQPSIRPQKRASNSPLDQSQDVNMSELSCSPTNKRFKYY